MNEFLKLFSEIGFKHIEERFTEIGIVNDYKYYPIYLQPNHYTLITFCMKNNPSDLDYRLYIHSETGKFVDSPFQINPSLLRVPTLFNEEIEKQFKAEMRDIKINQILN
jgi:hypothetical protein